MRLDQILLEVDIEHARKGDTEAAHRVLEMLDNYTNKGLPIPEILSSYMAEAAKKIDNGMTHDKAFNLSRKQGNQYSGGTNLKEINIARFVYNVQSYLKNDRVINADYLTLYTRPSEEAIEHIKTNFNPTIDEICDWLEQNELVPRITSRSAKNSENKQFMGADRIRKIYDRWVDGVKATEDQ